MDCRSRVFDPLPSNGVLFSASHRPGVGTDAAVSQSRQRLECGDLSPLFSASASQLAADPPVPRAKAPTSWRTPNAAASAKPALSVLTCRVRNALNTYVPEGQTAIAQRFIAAFGRASDMSPG